MNFKNAQRLSDAFGFMTTLELYGLEVCCRSLVRKNPVIINIGSGAGTSGLLFAEIMPYAQRYTIDKSTGGPFGGMQNEVNAFEGTGLILPNQVLGDSSSIGNSWIEKGMPNPVDLVFIDGDHSEEGITKDIEAWFPLIHSEGIIAFHDYSALTWPKVKTVVDGYFGGRKYLYWADSLIAFKISDVLYQSEEDSQ